MSEGCLSAIIIALGSSFAAIITSVAGLILALGTYAKGRANSTRIDRLENGKEDH